MMECSQCYRHYGVECRDTEDCMSGGGCSYTLPQAKHRDDLLRTGFMPKDFTPPLSVKLYSISGDDITREKVCPPETEAEFEASGGSAMSFRADIFITLTEMDNLGTDVA